MSDEEKIVSIPVPGEDFSIRAPLGAWHHEPSLGEKVEVHTHGYAMMISRDMAIAYGIVEATPQERAALDAQAQHWKARRKAYGVALTDFKHKYEHRVRADSAALQAVAAEHTMVEDDFGDRTCPACTSLASSHDEYEIEWPCWVVKTIAKVYGLEVPSL